MSICAQCQIIFWIHMGFDCRRTTCSFVALNASAFHEDIQQLIVEYNALRDAILCNQIMQLIIAINAISRPANAWRFGCHWITW